MVISSAGVLQAPRHAEADVVQDEVHDGQAHPRLLSTEDAPEEKPGSRRGHLGNRRESRRRMEEAQIYLAR